MLESTTLQLLVFPIGVFYLALHLGPLLRLWYEPAIRGGTRWQFFASELVVFSLWLIGSPVLWHSPIGRIAIVTHMSMHVVFTGTDYIAHDVLLRSALATRAKTPWMWIAKNLGLVIDTGTHATAVILVALTLPPWTVAALSVPSLGAYAWMTRRYLRQYGNLVIEGG